jgi:hypothetical protein
MITSFESHKPYYKPVDHLILHSGRSPISVCIQGFCRRSRPIVRKWIVRGTQSPYYINNHGDLETRADRLPACKCVTSRKISYDALGTSLRFQHLEPSLGLPAIRSRSQLSIKPVPADVARIDVLNNAAGSCFHSRTAKYNSKIQQENSRE